MVRDGVKNEKFTRESVIQGHYGGGSSITVTLPENLHQRMLNFVQFTKALSNCTVISNPFDRSKDGYQKTKQPLI